MKTIPCRRFIRVFCLFVLMGITAPVWSQTSYYFFVQFRNKNNSPYSLSNPSAYLSARAIARRTSFNISCDSTDLPVNPKYLSQLENLGAHVHSRSKWINGATVILSDSGKMSQVRALPFVRFAEYTGKQVGAVLAPAAKAPSVGMAFDYGTALSQISQLNGTHLHDEGYRGKGIQIAVLDGGFNNVNINSAFDSLRQQGRLLGTKDIINPTSNIYAEDSHGAMVLSTMAGNLQGQYLGTAPEASYWLIRTEYVPTEYKVETDFWCSGIEFADSVGVDLATSSLGYYTFDDSSMNFTYADMNGKVSRASRAATLAAKKGIVVLAAAGNEGQTAWKYIGSPADSDGIIAVGAVTSTGLASSFTSFGPSYDNRVKPEICARGTSSALVGTTSSTTYGNGTSFATPIMAGMMACLLQRYKSVSQNLSVQTLLQSVFRTGNQFNNPTAQLGYGIPDFVVAEQNLLTINSLNQTQNNLFSLAVNPSYNTLIIRFGNENSPRNASVRIYSTTGEMTLYKSITESVTVLRTDNLQTGIYAVCVTENGKTDTKKILIK